MKRYVILSLVALHSLAAVASIGPSWMDEPYLKTKGFPSIGPSNAEVTVVAFWDLACPYSAKAREWLLGLPAKFPNKVRVVVKQYPLPFRPLAKHAAIGAECAYRQGKFFAYSKAIFAGQFLPNGDRNELTEDILNASAAGLVPEKEVEGKKKFDLDKFNDCVKDPQVEKYIDEVKEEVPSESFGTPSFFVNGHRITGNQPEQVKQAVDDLLD